MKKKINLSMAIIITLIISLLSSCVSCLLLGRAIFNSEIYSVLNETDRYVDKYFYNETDENKLVDGALSGYMSGLGDKYARYQCPSEYKTTVVSDSGYLIGIGVTIKATEDGYMEITEFAPESSARDAGLQIGDIIKAVDGKDVAETGYNNAVTLIKNGESGSEVKLSVKRGEEIKDVTVKRIEMVITTASGQMLEDNIAYIKIEQFNATTFEQMNTTLEKLLSNGAESIIFDLRNNPGGMVSAVEKCTDPFLPEGDTAIATYKDGHTEVICRSDAEEMTIPTVILINENSASGAELFSALMRDYEKAKIVGKKSYGKGIMQTTHSLKNGGAITFTIATYQTVKSECYHEVGIQPDYEVEKGESDDITAVDIEKDAQLKKAVELLE